MSKKIEKLILSGKLLEAKELAHCVNYQELNDLLFTIAYNYKDISSYTFISMLLCEKESVEYHGIAMEILVHGLFYLEGAYETAMYHVRRSLELYPDDIGLKELLLFFNGIPCKPLKDEEANQIALEILKVDQNNKIAIKYAKKCS